MDKYTKCTLDSNTNLRDGEIIAILPTRLIPSQRNSHVLPFHVGIVSNKSHSFGKQLRRRIVLNEVAEARRHPSLVITCGTRPLNIDPIKFEVVVADRLHVEAELVFALASKVGLSNIRNRQTERGGIKVQISRPSIAPITILKPALHF